MADIGDVYLNALTKEKVYMTAGREFRSQEGQTIVIIQALYGLKSSGTVWHAHLAQSYGLQIKLC